MTKTIFSKDFILVVIGQIISLFGNATVRFILPLYLLNVTGSSVLFGTVTACAFLPSIVLSPLGGIVADRVNKRNIMVTLDFFTAGLILVFCFLLGRGNLVVILTATLMILYGVAGAYQPAVQASIPFLVGEESFMQANSIINTISSFASLSGPAIGGVLYSAYGLRSVLYVCAGCFFLSALMEIFIVIPFEKQRRKEGIWRSIKTDFGMSVHFIKNKQPLIGKCVIALCGMNLFLSGMIIVGLPYMVTEVLDFEKQIANQLCGFAQGALGAGGLVGGICAGIFAEKFMIQKAGKLLVWAAFAAFPMGIVAFLSNQSMLVYIVMTAACFFIMFCSTIFTVEMMSFIQKRTPGELIGKVIAVAITIAMCAQPLGNALYGILFEMLKGVEGVVILFAGIISLGIAVWVKHLFKEL